MRSKLEARLQRLEDEAERRSSGGRDEALDAILDCMGFSELMRGSNALMSGGDARIEEGWSLLERGRTRLAQGWRQPDKDALENQDLEKRDAVWGLSRALGQRHQLYPDVYRFDALDLSEAEIKQLAEVTETATCASDLEPLVEIVGRLRLDGRVMEMAKFESLVLRGEIAPPPPQPDWQEFHFLRLPKKRPEISRD